MTPAIRHMYTLAVSHNHKKCAYQQLEVSRDCKLDALLALLRMKIGVELASLVANGATNTIALKWREYTFLVQVGREGE
jgi:hypothetical protein